MALTNQLTGKTPTGNNIAIPVAGMAGSTSVALAANASWNTGIIAYNGNEAVHFALSSDVAGTYTIEYYLNGQIIAFTGNPTTYDPALVNSFQGSLSGKGDSFKLTYTNGSTAQTRFYLEVRFGDAIQQTQRSIGIPVSSTNMGGTTHAVIEGRESGTGNYKQATVTDNGAGKVAQDVNVLNGTSTDVSALAKESGGNLASILAKLSADPATQTTLAAILIAVSAFNTDQGAPTDAQATNSTGTWAEIQLLKGIMQRPATGTTTSNTTLATTTTVLAANPNRKGATCFSVTGTILVLLGSGASATVFTSRLITNAYYEVPFGYTGIITAIGAGTLLVTELV